MSERRTELGEKDGRVLYRWEKLDPSGKWVTFYRGEVYLSLPDGSEKKTPDDPFFKSEEDGRRWLETGK